MTKFSVITVTFNAAKDLKKTVRSVINQNIDDYEHIIIDKFSNDNTDEIIKKNKSQQMRFFKVNDRGIYDAMNIGIKKSLGEFIIFLNSGDEFYDTKTLQKTYTIIKKSNAKIFYGTCFLKEKKKLIETKPLFDPYSIPYCHQSIFINRNILKNNLFNLKFRFAADYDQFFRLKKFSFHKLNFCISRVLADGLSNQNQNLVLKEYLYINLKYKKSKFKSYIFFSYNILIYLTKKIIKLFVKSY